MKRLLQKKLLSPLLLLTSALIAAQPIYAETLTNSGNPIPYEIGRPGGTLTVSAVSLPKTFNAYLAAETSSTDQIGQMYLGLVTTDPMTTKIAPALAESWDVSSDKMTYRLRLRKGLKWSDGKPLTADDVVFTYNEIIDNANIPNNYRDGLLVPTADGDKFPEVSKIDNLTVQFKTAVPFVPFLRGLSDPIMPRHVFAGTTKVVNSKVAFNSMWGLNADVRKIVVNGPWKIKEFVADTKIVLEPNPYYYLKDSKGNALPYLKELTSLETLSLDDAVRDFSAGKTDLISFRSDEHETLVSKQAQHKFSIKNLGPATGTLFVMFNQSTAKAPNGKPVVDPIKSKWFRNTTFRQALAHAIDKEGMIQSIYKGRATPQTSHVSQQNPFYNPDTPAYKYDLLLAAAKLKEAGFKKNSQGQLMDAEGHPVIFNLVTNTGNAQRDAACAILQKDWRQLGINVSYKPIAFNQMVQQIDAATGWDAMMIGLTGSAIEPHGGINTWRLDGRMHMFNIGHPDYWKGESTTYLPWEKEVIALYEKAAQEFDPAQRKALYFKAQEIVAQQVPFMFTVNQLSQVAYNNRLGNIRPSIHGGNGINQLLWNSEHLFVKPEAK